MDVELDDVINIFNALLRISNLEYGDKNKHFSSVDVNFLLVDLVEFYQPLAIEKHQQLSADTHSYSFICDADLLFQAIANCIENAIKYLYKALEINYNDSYKKRIKSLKELK